MRRRFVDWNLFHVEPRFGEWRADFRRVASQRNAWLRAGARGPAVWDRAYAEGMARIEAARQGFAARLAESFSVLTTEIEWFQGLQLEWRSGLGDAEDSLSRLEDARETDRRRGFTALGLSRDDLAITADGHRWAGSRGEAKIVGVLLQVAAQRIVDALIGLPALWLVDDLSAELADASSDRLLEIVSADATQLIVTSLPGRMFESVGPSFHVEQGSVHRYSPPAAITATHRHPTL
jgi:DNA replication and repair protein RecF